MRSRVVVLALALASAPLGAEAADLVVWWEQGCYPEEDEAVAEIIAAFEQETGKQVELVHYDQDESSKTSSRRRSRRASRPTSRSAYVIIRLRSGVGLRRSARRPDGRCRPLLGPVRSGRARARPPCSTARRAGAGCTRCRWAATTNHVHVWKSLLEQAGFTLADIPQGVGGVLVVLVRPGAAGGAQGHGPRRHLGRRPRHVGRRRPTPNTSSTSSISPTAPIWVTPRRPARDRRSGGPAEAHRGDRAPTPRSTARAARRPTAVSWTNCRQQQGVPRPDAS